MEMCRFFTYTRRFSSLNEFSKSIEFAHWHGMPVATATCVATFMSVNYAVTPLVRTTDHLVNVRRKLNNFFVKKVPQKFIFDFLRSHFESISDVLHDAEPADDVRERARSDCRCASQEWSPRSRRRFRYCKAHVASPSCRVRSLESDVHLEDRNHRKLYRA